MLIDGVIIARVVHMLALVHWIGGVCIVTTVILPRARRLQDAAEAISYFEEFERRFARQARISILFAGLSGFYMLVELNAWDRLRSLASWWLDLMIAVWLVFAILIYLLEPLFIHAAFHRFAQANKERAFSIAQWLHLAALVAAVVAISGGILGSHGALPWG